MPDLPLRLSVLDLAPVSDGASVGDALRASIALARRVEELGYHRLWVAEHHNMPGIASSAPAVLLAHLASVTSSIRLGSGGVMLPNHSPLVVAEQFGMLEALHPGRIDLGIGRAPGTDPLTAQALRRSRYGGADDFPEQLDELRSYFTGRFRDGHPFARITAVPGTGHEPALWLLGSSDYSAYAAGVLGLPFSFAHHFMAVNTGPALAVYRSSFRPSDDLAEPYTMLGVNVICAPTDAEAQRLAKPGLMSFVRLRQGHPTTLPSDAEAAAYEFTPLEQRIIAERASSQIVGSPATVAGELRTLANRFRVEELMLTTMVHRPADRLRSYELIADAFALAPRPVPDPVETIR